MIQKFESNLNLNIKKKIKESVSNLRYYLQRSALQQFIKSLKCLLPTPLGTYIKLDPNLTSTLNPSKSKQNVLDCGGSSHYGQTKEQQQQAKQQLFKH